MAELADDNYLACRALFGISSVEFSDRVPTLAVSLSRSPVLCINKTFIGEYVQTGNDLKGLLLHEFLHVLLNHTRKFSSNNLLLNLALDAIINSIIHRHFGSEYSEIFCRLYKEEGFELLLRPLYSQIRVFNTLNNTMRLLNYEIYRGAMTADDLYELLKAGYEKKISLEGFLFIGNHCSFGESEGRPDSLAAEIAEALRFSSEIGRLFNQYDGGNPFDFESRAEQYHLSNWRKGTLRLLRKCLIAEGKVRVRMEGKVILPGYHRGNRRAVALQDTGGILPFSPCAGYNWRPSSEVNVYLDSSSSMTGEFNQLVSLLYSFRRSFNLKILTFSTSLHRAVFQGGKLRYRGTDGTYIICVFDHIRKTNPARSLIITDGYTGSIPDSALEGIDRKNIKCLISPNGQPHFIKEAGIDYYHLKPLKSNY